MNYKNYSNQPYVFWLGITLLVLFGGINLLISLVGLFISTLVTFFPIIIFGYFIIKIVGSMNKNSRINHTIKKTSIDHQRFTELLIRILAHVVQADGKVDDKEISVIIQYFHSKLGFPNSRNEWLVDLITYSINQRESLHELCDEFSSKFSYQSKLILIDMIYQVALADNHLHEREIAIITQIVSLLEVFKTDHDQIKAAYITKPSANQLDQYYAILGVSPTATKEDLKKAYKAACKKYHPDTVHHLGDEYKAVAENKIKEITKAYQELKPIYS